MLVKKTVSVGGIMNPLAIRSHEPTAHRAYDGHRLAFTAAGDSRYQASHSDERQYDGTSAHPTLDAWQR